MPVGGSKTVPVDVRVIAASQSRSGGRKSRRAGSAKISSIASTSCRSRSRRCASARRTSRARLALRLHAGSGPGMAPKPFSAARCAGCSAGIGLATCVSCATRWSGS